MSEGHTERLEAALDGKYRIERKLGEGGMASVYLAEDVKHKRKVALKILRPELAAVLGTERFLAEIQTTAQLQHPHILPLHDSGEADGYLYYVMPFIDGPTLREKLDREKQLRVDEAVRIATDVAEALHAAHEQGVIHRDVKPANILLSKGRPLVADFGIALAISAAGGGRLTETGMSMGTPYYMSPEQASADREPTAASDVYALGCVLYEMLVGEPPHVGGSAQAVLAKILTDDPPTPKKARPSIPANVDAAVRRSLQKLPTDRFESARGFGIALGDPEFRYGANALAAATDRRGLWNPLSTATVGSTLMLLLAFLWAVSRPESSVPVSRQLLSTEGWAGLELPFGRYAAIAPDGSSMILPVGSGAEPQLGLKTRNSLEIAPITGTEQAVDVAYSPDGQSIVYRVGARLLRQPLAGGSAVTLAEDANPSNVTSIAWLEDGSILYEAEDESLERPRWIAQISQDGEPLQVVFPANDEVVGPAWAHGLPDGRGALLVACVGTGACTADRADLFVVDLEGPSSKLLTEQVIRAWYTRTGHILYVRSDGAVFAAPFDVDALEITGSAVPLFSGVRVPGLHADMLLGDDGTLVYAESEGVPQGMVLVWVDRDGTQERVDANLPPQTFRTMALSPDDGRLALSIVGDDSEELWIKDLPGGALTRLSNDPGQAQQPVWSPDGGRVAYITDDGDRAHARTVPSDGSSNGEYEILLEHERPVLEVLFTPNQSLIFRMGGGGGDLGMAGLDTDSVDDGWLASEFSEQAVSLSPDGSWIAYVSDLTGRNEVFVRPFPNVGDGRVQVSTSGGTEPLWAHNGREIFYRESTNTPAAGMMAAAFVEEPTFQIVSRQRLFDASPYYALSVWRAYDVTNDDQRFAMIRMPGYGAADTARLIQVMNFHEELKLLVPN